MLNIGGPSDLNIEIIALMLVSRWILHNKASIAHEEESHSTSPRGSLGDRGCSGAWACTGRFRFNVLHTVSDANSKPRPDSTSPVLDLPRQEHVEAEHHRFWEANAFHQSAVQNPFILSPQSRQKLIRHVWPCLE